MPSVGEATAGRPERNQSRTVKHVIEETSHKIRGSRWRRQPIGRERFRIKELCADTLALQCLHLPVSFSFSYMFVPLRGPGESWTFHYLPRDLKTVSSCAVSMHALLISGRRSEEYVNDRRDEGSHVRLKTW